ncbi:MAG TPA: TIGR04551 family protein [Polyangiaceae bacterium]|jgi:uncharacterized protein (TIGR04551 family)|nr:TIGR04551 family protein [Polyangiaceae bacterium]
MRKGSLAVTALTGLVSWTALASAAEPPATKKPVPAASATAPAPKADAPSKTPADAVPPTTKGTTVTAPKDTPGATSPAPSDEDAAKPTNTAGESSEESPAGGALPPESEPPAHPAPAPGTARAGAGFGPIGLFPEQSRSEPAPAAQMTMPAQQKSTDGVLAEDWWSHARPVFELHGYFRTRAELFHNFSLGRNDSPLFAVWPQPADNSYTTPTGAVGPNLCTPSEAGHGGSDNPAQALTGCRNKTQAGANIRFRLDPELHISDNLRIISQVDILDDVVLGSNPSGYGFQPAPTGGYQVSPRSGYAPNGILDDTTVAPASGVNSLSNSIAVKRVWAEYTTPVGELRFGRMPDHFGLGMVHNAGNGYDDDYQSTIDRLQFITSIKPLDLYIGGSWDFPNEGLLRQPSIVGGQPYDASQLDDVNQWSLIVMRKESAELTKNELAHGNFVLNGGAYVTLRKQLLADDQNGASGTAATAQTGANVPDATALQQTTGFTRRNSTIWLPDLWFQLKYKKFRFELEGAAVVGSFDNTGTGSQTNFATTDLGRKLREYGLAAELEQHLIEDKLRLEFKFGWASGDSSAFNPNSTNNLVPAANQQQVASDTISTFRFNPAYRIDLILNRNLLGRVQGTYYFNPSVEYDFMRKASGQRLGGGASVVWTRASEFVQTPGHASDLGIELDGKLYFQSKDGSLNDQPGKMGGFYAMLEYGVLFPLAGLGYQSVEKARNNVGDTSAAQILRMYLGVMF